ncbi:AAA family ATPase [Kitasatospora gansuensis]
MPPDGFGPELLERRSVLDEAARLADHARHGRGSLLLLTGPTGVGRSALLDALARSEAAQLMTVLRANCAADEAGHPYAAARQLAGPGIEFGPGPDGAAPWEVLREHAIRRPLLLLVDDVQDADTPSRCWLSQLGRRLERLPVLAVVTERRQPGRAGRAPRFGQDLPAGTVHPHRIGPLTRGGVAELLSTRLGGPAPDDLVDDCLRATGGTPLLLHALLHALLTELGGPGHPLGDTPGGAFQDAVGHWLRAAANPSPPPPGSSPSSPATPPAAPTCPPWPPTAPAGSPNGCTACAPTACSRTAAPDGSTSSPTPGCAPPSWPTGASNAGPTCTTGSPPCSTTGASRRT